MTHSVGPTRGCLMPNRLVDMLLAARMYVVRYSSASRENVLLWTKGRRSVSSRPWMYFVTPTTFNTRADGWGFMDARLENGNGYWMRDAFRSSRLLKCTSKA